MPGGQNTFGNRYDNFDFSVRAYNRARLYGAWRCRNRGMSRQFSVVRKSFAAAGLPTPLNRRHFLQKCE